MSTFDLHLGDNRQILPTLADNSIDSCVTDPPYELGFMGRAWDKSGIAYDVEMWRQVLRILKPGGHLLAFGGSRTYHRLACAIEEAGFEIRDQIMWIYGSGFPKSHNLKGEFEGWGTALKPAHEPIVVARKPFKGSVAENVQAFGTGAVNIDASRIHAPDATSKDYQIKRFAPGATVNTSGEWKQDALFTGKTKAGRWPANVIHDGSEEVVSAFPTVSSGKPAGVKKAGNNVYGEYGTGIPITGYGDSGSAARFFYSAKADRDDRNEGLKSFNQPVLSHEATMREREKADWSKRNGNHHPTVKPTDLMQYLCRLVTPAGGTVLDLFMGSGSTGKACMKEQFSFIGIELLQKHHAIAKTRIEHAHRKYRPQLNLFP